MVEQSQNQKPNPNPKPKTNPVTKNNNKKKSEYEFCKVCNLNHDQGQRHKYFPSHKSSLSSFLSRFQTKLSDIRFFLKNPTPLRPEHDSRNRFWCVFCDSDIDERGSSFACKNAINHLASADHLKNLKHLMWKYGGGMDRLDTFRALEADVAKWEKKCKLMESEAVLGGEGSRGPVFGPSNDIHNELNYGNIDSFENSSFQSVKSSLSNGVMPLQYYTNEYQVSYSGVSEVTNVGMVDYDVNASLPAETCSGTNSWNLKDLTACNSVNRNSQHSLLSNSRKCSADGNFSNEGMYQVYEHGGMVKGESWSQGLQNLTKISSMAPQEARGNVHSGALPPWFEGTEESGLNVQLKPAVSIRASPSNKVGKSKKLNPNRVGAAWAERRKIELEMEKRGAIVKSDCDTNWLPNFGRVWQSGSRKESRKEFEMEKQKLLKVESQPEMPIKIQPYVSKRMRRDVGE